MAHEGTINWPGASGREYKYWIYPIGTTFKDEPGNYVFSKKTSPGQWTPVYIGERPRPVFVEAARQGIEVGCISGRSIQSGSAEHMILTDHLARRFSVSRQATRIRLSAFGIVHDEIAPAAF